MSDYQLICESSKKEILNEISKVGTIKHVSSPFVTIPGPGYFMTQICVTANYFYHRPGDHPDRSKLFINGINKAKI